MPHLLPKVALAAACFAAPAFAADEKRSIFIDPDDGYFDGSEWLIDRKGFLPVPIIITEPAVGYGGGVALLFIRESIREVTKGATPGHVTPPDIFGGMVFGTENGTKGYGGGGMFSFADDRWRYRGGVAKVDVNLDFYGIGGKDRALGYNLDGIMSMQQVLYRLGESSNFIALRWIYLDLKNRFNLASEAAELPAFSRAETSSGVGLSFEHDSRDNIFTPNSGWTGTFDTTFYSPDVGSDHTYQAYRGKIFAYFPIEKKFVIGARIDGRAARGDVPFYQLPFIDMRGIPAARYQDENTGVLETEVRWNVTPRWSLVGFIGASRAWGKDTNFKDAGTAVAKGVGFRYLIARRLGLYIGMDVARGPEDDAFYIQVGNAWR
ncbi:BamA/TamA family outer membrane protein [Usitatibacter palustris]|uniref:Bacterial surface antigen (D15) domain-containing protein n=1 Tax=Usitatibacter palustris TaxID=2732487 RepID=A0A6M4H7H1_9PROT|nr:BamA/TamA family outer membrane protein [Usitatibacter palustris]QJR14324.1 hypothetical protein DSM104440_01120 [Usitatibacter palustris]